MADISPALRIESVCDVFAAALRHGESPRIESFLGGWEGASRDDLLRRLLGREIEHRSQSGDTLPVQDYRERFAGQIHVVEQLLGGAEELAQVVERLGELGLIPPDERRQLQAELATGETSLTVEALCRRLVVQRRLTEYQAQAVCCGEQDPLVLGDYLILDKIGQGGMGVVYRARQPGLNRLVALKTILSRESAGTEAVHRFRQEAESAARLQHPGIVSVFDFGEARGVHFFAMEFIEGASLTAKLAEAVLAPQEAARLVRQLAEAVAYAHAQGVIHRDLKPANILLGRDGTPRITDFGIAKLVDREGHTVTGDVLGTPSYMPPEQALGQAGAVRETADIYALGAILYACLCGHPPFKAETVLATLKLVIEQPPVPLRQFNQRIPVDLETICLKCLEKDPQQRYAAAADLAAELQRFLNGEPILARPLRRVERFQRWCRRNPLVAGLSATAALLLVVGTITSTYFAVLASRRAARAEEGTRIAVETLESVIFQMQDKLRSIPAAREARREVLKQAMQELQKLSDLQVRSSRMDLGTAVVLVRFAAIIFDIGSDESLGSLDAAEKNLDRACEIFAKCHAANPTDRQIRQEWGFALIKAGDVAVTLHKLDRARLFIDQALARFRELSAEEPQVLLWRKQLAYALTVSGDILMMTGKPAEALLAFREARELMQLLHDREPGNADYQDVLLVASEKQADAQLREGDVEAARRLYAENLQFNLDYLAQDPADPARMYSLSFCYERLAEFAVREGQPAAAAEHYERELDVILQAIEADPKNAKYRQEIQMPLGKLTGLYQQLQRGESAAAAQKRVEEVLARTSR